MIAILWAIALPPPIPAPPSQSYVYFTAMMAWDHYPSAAQVRAATPDGLAEKSAITLHCSVASDGTLGNCKPFDRSAEKRMLEAALILVPLYRLPVPMPKVLFPEVTLTIAFATDREGRDLPQPAECAYPFCTPIPSIPPPPPPP